MTTAAMVLAMLPMAKHIGEGGEFRAPLAVTVIGGLLTSTFLTLLVIPAVYGIVDDAQRVVSQLPSRMSKLGRHGADPKIPVAEPGLVAGGTE